MVHPYLNRRQGKEPVTYPSEALKEALGRTLGVPVFQEQVMQISMLAAGFTPGEADGLRRAMAAWKRKGGLDRYYDKIVDGMTSRGYDKEFAESHLQADPRLQRVRLPGVAMRRRSRCSSTRAAGSSGTTRPSSWPPC